MNEALTTFDDLMLDVVARLCLAYPRAVPYGRVQRLLDGRWADEATSGASICTIRRLLGSTSIITVRRGRRNPGPGGYVASDALHAAWSAGTTSPFHHYIIAGRVLTSGSPNDAIRACDDITAHPRVRELVDRGLRDPDLGRLLALAATQDLDGTWPGTTTMTPLPHGAGGSSTPSDLFGDV